MSFKDTNFSSSRNKLNFKPKIKYIEPDQIIPDELPIQEEQEPTIDEIQQLTNELIQGYQDLALLADEAQKRIDEVVGNYVINLDSEQDTHIIDALRRLSNTPDNVDNALEIETGDSYEQKTISYSAYKDALKVINEETLTNYNKVDQKELDLASIDPFRNTFGGMEKAAGLRRPELEKTNQSIKPVNLKKFKLKMVLKLFNLLQPMIKKLAIKLIKKFIKF